MRDDKLFDRMEDITWEPPVLSFTIERHGPVAAGSKRAPLHRWSVNLEQNSATVAQSGSRQVRPTEPKLNVEPIADDLIRHIMAGEADDRLKWLKPGHRVRILIGKVIPAGLVAKQTLAGRRRRLGRAIESRLSAAGWSRIPGTAAHTYGRVGGAP